MKFENTRKRTIANMEDWLKNQENYIDELTVKEAVDSLYARAFMTKKTLKAVKDCKREDKIPAELTEQMKAKAEKIKIKIEQSYLDRLQAAEACELPAAISIVVKWRDSATYGADPTATIQVGETRVSETTTGCGYDKESAAIAGALNKSVDVLSIILNAIENGINPGDGVRCQIFPFFERGCGVNCFYSIFENCGYTFKKIASKKNLDCYEIIKKGE